MIATLNLGSAVLLGLQGLIVGLMIQSMDTQSGPPWTRGIYIVRKNLYVLRRPDNANPQCALPVLLINGTGGPLHIALEGTGLQIRSTNFYQFLDTYAVPHSFEVGFLDVRYVICAFFLLSFLFHMLQVAGASGRLRFVEYSLSASLMILAMAVQVGLTEVYLLCCMFALIFATNVLGLMAEILQREAATTPWLWLLPHGLAWTTFLVAYAPLVDAYLSAMRCSDRRPPGYAHVIVFLEFALFGCFGGLQLYVLYRRTSHALSGPFEDEEDLFGLKQRGSQGAAESEGEADWEALAYIVLSFTAKTLLAWLVLAPTLVRPDQLFAS
jgi:hypothetical protein